MITEKDLHKGLQFKHYNNKENTIYTINEKMQITWINENNFLEENSSYPKKEICDYINNGKWIIINPINKIYELW